VDLLSDARPMTPEEEDSWLYAQQLKYLRERGFAEPIPAYSVKEATLHRAVYFPPREEAHDASPL
jgi:hypothetical protein